MTKKFGFRSVRTSIIVTVSICLIILIFGILATNNIVLTKSMKQQNNEELNSSSELAAEVINGWTERQFHISKTNTGSLEFIQNADDVAIEYYLEEQLKDNSDALMYYVAYADNLKILAADHSDLTGIDPTTGEYWTKAMAAQDVVFSSPYSDSVSGKMMVSMAQPFTLNGRQAVFIADITIDKLNSIVKSIMSAEDIEAFLVDENDNIIVHANSAFEPTSDGSTNITSVSKIDTSSNEVMLSKDYDGEDKYVSVHTIDETGWKVGVMKSQKSIQTKINSYGTVSMVVGFIIAIIISLFQFVFIAWKLAPLGVVKSNLLSIRDGKLNIQLSDSNRVDDIGALQNATNDLVKTLSGIINKIIFILGEMASGDFTVEDMPEYNGDYDKITVSVNKIKSDLSSILKQVSDSAYSVKSGSQELADAATSLAQGTTEQASSVENIVDVIADITEKVNQNADNCKVIDQNLKEFEDLINKGNENMTSLSENVQNIEKMSNDIRNIVDSIDAIAFQTNILALNASVEAARAGEHGRGFAVVAEEVRSLANKSAEESHKTDELITECIKAIVLTKSYADETKQEFDSIVSGVKNIVNTFEQISTATDEQAQNTQNVKHEIENVSDVLQSTTATTEETAASTETLSNQADKLNSIISKFKI